MRRARAWAWVSSLPEGLGTHVGEDGSRVSGGERQRIALARALLANVRLLVLDEPDEHLDEENADALVRDLLAAARAEGLGVPLITHRAIDPLLVDRTAVLRDGHVASVAGRG